MTFSILAPATEALDPVALAVAALAEAASASPEAWTPEELAEIISEQAEVAGLLALDEEAGYHLLSGKVVFKDKRAAKTVEKYKKRLAGPDGLKKTLWKKHLSRIIKTQLMFLGAELKRQNNWARSLKTIAVGTVLGFGGAALAGPIGGAIAYQAGYVGSSIANDMSNIKHAVEAVKSAKEGNHVEFSPTATKIKNDIEQLESLLKSA